MDTQINQPNATPPETNKPAKNTLKTHKNPVKTAKNGHNTLILKNKKHELFAQAMVDPTIKTPAEAAKKIYGHESMRVSSTVAGRLLANVDIRTRVLELLQSNKSTNMERLTQKLGEHVESEKGELSLKAVELGYKLHGALDANNMGTQEPADININIIANANNTNELQQ